MTSGIEHAVNSAGIIAPIAFVVIYAGLTVALVPATPASVAAGALFGAVWGSVLTVVGATLGATGAYLLARGLGRAPLRVRSGDRLERLDAWVGRHGFRAVLYVRLVPLLPFNVVNYVFGLTSVRPRQYVAATALGIVPGTVAFVALGSSLRDPGSVGFVVSLAATVALALVGAVATRRTRIAQRRADTVCTAPVSDTRE
ncbi:MAG: TVP38/TMEM64 family protein [Solirubrobacterales bacterium]